MLRVEQAFNFILKLIRHVFINIIVQKTGTRLHRIKIRASRALKEEVYSEIYTNILEKEMKKCSCITLAIEWFQKESTCELISNFSERILSLKFFYRKSYTATFFHLFLQDVCVDFRVYFLFQGSTRSDFYTM